jgi:hypothetical protein
VAIYACPREGGGCVTGPVDETGNLTGSEVVFIYPDWRTCYLGTFRDGVLVQGRRTTARNLRITKVRNVLKTNFAFAEIMARFSERFRLALSLPKSGVIKRCRLSWRTNSVLVYKSKCGGMWGLGEGCGLRGLSR